MQNLLAHALFLFVVDHLLPEVLRSLKNKSLETLRIRLSLKSPSTVELFRALSQSRLKEFRFSSSDEQVVRLLFTNVAPSQQFAASHLAKAACR